MQAGQDYREGLSAEELVGTLQGLLGAEQRAMRLTCRYLADFADCMEGRGSMGGVGGARGSGGVTGVEGRGGDAGSSGGVTGAGGRGGDAGSSGGVTGAGGRGGGALAGYADVYHAARCLFGLGAHTTRERIRVGRALRSLPRIEEAFLSRELSYSRTREVTRVATAEDESAWLLLARELPIRTLERRVAEAAGKGPKARTADPAQVRRRCADTVEVTLHLPAETWALVQRAMEGARRASEASLSDAEALAAVARDALARQVTDVNGADPRRAVVLYECQSCARTELDTGGGPVELGVGAAATLGCGAREWDLRTEGRTVQRGGPLPSAIERAVRLRDRNTCRVPGCFRRRYVDVHHITFQSKGGEHSRTNCVCLCTTHHGLLHDGRLRIEGDAEGELLFHDETGAPLPPPAASHSGTSTVSGAPASHRGTSAVSGASASHRGTSGVSGASRGSHGRKSGVFGASASHSGTSNVSGAFSASAGGTGVVSLVAHRGTAGVPDAAHNQGETAGVPVGAPSGGALGAELGASDSARALLALLGRGGRWSVDALIDASGLGVGEVASALLKLEIEGRIEGAWGGDYEMCARRA
ncbi:MAG: hypothetical protein R3F14_00615 [Polyangiaceae bacterium]